MGEFSELLKSAIDRMRGEITRNEIAKRCKIDSAAITKYINNSILPPLDGDKVNRLAKELKIDKDCLYRSAWFDRLPKRLLDYYDMKVFRHIWKLQKLMNNKEFNDLMDYIVSSLELKLLKLGVDQSELY